MKSKFYTQYERDVFKQLVLSNPTVLSKSTTLGGASREAKNKAWQQITEDYNRLTGVTPRSVVQLKKLWQNMKALREECSLPVNSSENTEMQETVEEEFIVLQEDDDEDDYSDMNEDTRDSSIDFIDHKSKTTLVPNEAIRTETVESTGEPRKKLDTEGMRKRQYQETLNTTDEDINSHILKKVKKETELAELLIQNARAEEARKAMKFKKEMKILETEERIKNSLEKKHVENCKKEDNDLPSQTIKDNKTEDFVKVQCQNALAEEKRNMLKFAKEINFLEAEEKRKQIRFEKEQEFLDKKRKLELEILSKQLNF